jgi:hypothetical protein
MRYPMRVPARSCICGICGAVEADAVVMASPVRYGGGVAIGWCGVREAVPVRVDAWVDVFRVWQGFPLHSLRSFVGI